MVSIPQKQIRKAYIDCPDGQGGQLQIHYREAGTPSNSPIVLLHQSPSSSQMYEAMMLNLAKDYWVIAPDTIGFGQSDALDLLRDLEVSDYAKVIKVFLNSRSIEHCYLFGHHTGSSVAVQLEFDYPGTAIAMSLSGPTLLSDEMKAVLPSKAEPFTLKEDGSHLQGMWDRMRSKDSDADLALTLREVMLGFSCGEQYQAAYLAVTRQDFEAQLKTITCPVQVFAGDEDPLFNSVQPTLAALPKGVAAVVGPGARTYVCDNRAKEVAALLRKIFI